MASCLFSEDCIIFTVLNNLLTEKQALHLKCYVTCMYVASTEINREKSFIKSLNCALLFENDPVYERHLESVKLVASHYRSP